MILKILPQISVSQNNIDAIAAESKLWDPPPKSTSCMEKSEPSLEWQQLLKYILLFQYIKNLYKIY